MKRCTEKPSGVTSTHFSTCGRLWSQTFSSQDVTVYYVLHISEIHQIGPVSETVKLKFMKQTKPKPQAITIPTTTIITMIDIPMILWMQ